MVFESAPVALIVATFFFAGLVKGVTGLGLPPMVLGILTATIGIHPAKALILIPTFFTNIWQACVGGNERAILARTWLFLLTATVMIGVASFTLSWVDTSLLSFLLGLVLMLYGAAGLRNLRLNIPGRWRHPAGLIFGTTNGILTGLTGSSAVPGVFYLQTLGFNREELLQGMGILFTLSTIGLALSLGMQNLLTGELGLMSAGAMIPAMIGMVIGQKISKNMPEVKFRKLFYVCLLLLGFYNSMRSLPV